jgi:hypothetical protein
VSLQSVHLVRGLHEPGPGPRVSAPPGPRASPAPGSTDNVRVRVEFGPASNGGYVEHLGISRAITFSQGKSYSYLLSSYACDTVGLRKEIPPT